MNSKLFEGLRGNELDYLVMPMITVDEYESKISRDEDVIVAGFYVDHEDPAKELSRFIDKSVQNILDTDVSPAPTPSGYFVVFVELERNEEVYTTLAAILKEIENIVSIEKWQFKTYKNEDVMDFTEENFNEYVRISQPTHECFKIHNFLKNMLIENIMYNENMLEFGRYSFKIDKLVPVLSESIHSATLEDIAATQRFNEYFGPSYQTAVSGNAVEILNVYRNETLRLKQID